ncbi:efflux RND transporter periplasmic adaptor subunit [Pontibacter anaerobius]|uniref:Efflux RND transporter periplasmic adaptor subunit n=1 Tax=Pontibacter anaerobius TaxID=2993940 RepID=A0ABT3RJ95_9BACT|nr:efflux RND transporter periplasmic adaptor subunit [Pontibacter anaerobius]MCX2741444.1 efflux RND transporter periplasmic adaptor subunit [Pontibacter anaerobius]
MKSKLYILSILGAVTFLSSCGGSEHVSKPDAQSAVEVSVVSPSGTNHTFVTASGKVEAVNSATLSTRNMGYINRIKVKIGDEVRKGQLLISINNTDLQAKRAQVNAGITEATVAYENAAKDYQRFKALFADNSATQKELDDMTANYEMAKARLDGARQMKNEINAQFAYANITAPFDGVVTGKFVEVGDMANPGAPLLSIEAPGKYQVTASVPESEISAIQTGAAVKVLVKSIDKTLSGKVTEISTSAIHSGGQYLVKIALDDTDARVLSGMYASVQFPTSNSNVPNNVLVPADAIVALGDLTGIYTPSEQNTAILRWVRVGRSFGNEVEVLSGLGANEKYIARADGKLYNGAHITIK